MTATVPTVTLGAIDALTAGMAASTRAAEARLVAATAGLTAAADAMAAAAARMQANAAKVAAAYTEAVTEVADAVADGRTPDGLPAAGRCPRARRLVLTARAMARRDERTTRRAAAVWDAYTAAIWADDDTDAELEAARADLCASPAVTIPTPHRPARVLASNCTRAARGLAAPAAGNAPPSRYRALDLIRGGPPR